MGLAGTLVYCFFLFFLFLSFFFSNLDRDRERFSELGAATAGSLEPRYPICSLNPSSVKCMMRKRSGASGAALNSELALQSVSPCTLDNKKVQQILYLLGESYT